MILRNRMILSFFIIGLFVGVCYFPNISTQDINMKGSYGLSDGLVSYWNFDNSTDIGYDHSGRGHNGINYGATWQSDGAVNGSIRFDGYDDYIFVSDHDDLDLDSTDFTISFWCKPEDSGLQMNVFSKALSGSSDGSWALRTNVNNNTWVFQNFDSTGFHPGYNPTTTPLNNWSMVTMTYNISSGKFNTYINNRLDFNTSISMYLNNTTIDLYIGSVEGLYHFFNGSLDEIRIYNRVLNSSEVLDLYCLSSKCPVAIWHFDEGTGSIAYDSSGNGNHGTINGATWCDGINGTALNFDGIDDYVDITDINLNTTWNWTVTALIKTDDIDYNAYKWRVGAPVLGDINNSVQCEIGLDNGTIAYNYAYDHNQGTEITGNSIIADNNIHFVVWRNSNNLIDMFVDGEIVVEDNISGPVNVQDSFKFRTIGKGFDGFYRGILDEIRVYTSYLTDNEIYDLYQQYGISNNDLIAYWSFDEGEGTTAYDESGNGYNCTIHDATWADGKLGYALDYDNYKDYLIVNSDFPFLSNATWTAWIYPRENTSCTIMGRWDPDDGWQVCLHGGNLRLETPNNIVYASNQEIPVNEWTHIAVTVDGSHVRLYINGNLDNNITQSYPIKNYVYPTVIGTLCPPPDDADYGCNWYFNGLIDELYVYNSSKTEDEIIDLYQQYESSNNELIAYWSFDNSSNLGYDDSGNSHNGINNGAIWNSSGIFNGAIEFDGINDYVNITNFSDFEFDENDNFTINFWRKDLDDTCSYYISCSADPSDSDYSGWGLHSSTYPNSGSNCGKGVGFYITEDAYNISTFDDTFNNEWHMITITKTGTILTLFVDGIQRNTTTISTPYYQDHYLIFGAVKNDGIFHWFYHGILDEIRIYNKSLNQSEIITLFDTPPIISNVTSKPNPQNINNYVNISCDVTDDGSVDVVKVNITSPNGDYINESMNSNGYYYNTSYSEVGTYNFYIWAKDNSDKQKKTGLYSFTITADAFLNIYSAEIIFTNNNPDPGENITITSKIHNTGSEIASNVTIQFYDNDILIGEKTNLTISPSSFIISSVEWTAQPEGIHPIKIQAYGDDTNTAIATKSIIVGQSFGSIDLTATVSPSICYSSDQIKIQGTAVYNTTYGAGSPVAGADITVSIINQTTQWTTQTTRYGSYLLWITAPDIVGNYTIIVEVSDYTFTSTLQKLFQVIPYADCDLPDLIVKSLSLSEYNPLVNESISLTTSIKNIGSQNASNVHLRFYVSSTIICNAIISHINSNEIIQKTINWTPTTVGKYTLKVIVDPDDNITECNENNNVYWSSKKLNVYPILPDLIPVDISFSDTTPAVNQEIMISAQIYNIGGNTVNDFKIDFYDNETYIGNYTLSLPGKHGNSWVSIPYTFLSPGIHTIKICVDPDNSIIEYREDNNNYSESIEVHLENPDIIIDSLWFSDSTPLVDETITIYAIVMNNGEINASDFYVSFYDDAIEINTTFIDYLDVGYQIEINMSWMATPVGWHLIKACGDSYDNISEHFENNNCRSRSLAVGMPCPDLEIYSSDISFSNSQPDVYENITISANIYNNDIDPAINVTVSFLFDEINFHDLEISEISGFETVICNVSHIFTEIGSHVVRIKAYPGSNNPPDQDPDDNEASKGIVVGVAPDLKINETDIMFSKTNPVEGDTIWINTTVHNIGNQNATNVTVSFYDGNPDLGGIHIATKIINITFGFEKVINITMNTMGFTGNHWIYAIADPFDDIIEFNEENNQAFKLLNIAANTPPIADFTYFPVNPIEFQIVEFTDNSTDVDGYLINWTWEFGEGNGSYEQYPTHQYTNSGNYTVILNITDNYGAYDEMCKQLTVIPDNPPIQTIELGSLIIEDVYYTGMNWLDLIGSQTPVWINSTDIETGADYIKYKLFQADVFGEWNDPPWVFVYDNQVTGNPFTTDIDPTVGRISIMFSIQENCFHEIHAHCIDTMGNWNYSTPLDFLVDSEGPSNDEIAYINFYQGPGGARYMNNQSIKRIWANDTGCTGGVAGVKRIDWRIEDSTTVTIASGIVNDNNITVYEDEYVIVSGDFDMTVGKMMIEISLKQEGIHFIYHQAIDSLENQESGRKQLVYVDLNPPVIQNMTISPEIPFVNQQVQISAHIVDSYCGVDLVTINLTGPGGASSINESMLLNIEKYQYDFILEYPGLYTYFIWTKDHLNHSKKSTTMYFTVFQKPTADFTYSPLEPNIGENVTFQDSSNDADGNITSWSWTFGDGGSSIDQNPTHDYDSSGRFSVTLTVEDDDGFNDSITKLVPVGLDLLYVQDLSADWNFVGLPFNDSLNKNNFLFKFDGYYYGLNNGIINPFMYGWNRAGQYYTFANTFNPGFGYWVFAYEDCELWIEEQTPNNDDYITTMESGWNVIGLPFDQTINKNDVIVRYDDMDHSWDQAVSDGVVINFVYGWNRPGQYYQFANDFIPGEAYWVYASQTCMLKRDV